MPKESVLRNRGTTVVVADASQMDCHLLAGAIQRQKHFQVRGFATNVNDAVSAVRKNQPDIVVLSARLQDGERAGFSVLKQLRAQRFEARVVIVLDNNDQELVVAAFREGARGVFCRTGAFAELRACMQNVLKGKIWATKAQWEWIVAALGKAPASKASQAPITDALTKREQEVARLVAAAMSNRELSEKLGLSAHTIKNYLSRIFEKLGISTRTELVLYVLSQSKPTSPHRNSEPDGVAQARSA
jgi:two-component system, NarL family, nitrate/nitrite response regulator NarL